MQGEDPASQPLVLRAEHQLTVAAPDEAVAGGGKIQAETIPPLQWVGVLFRNGPDRVVYAPKGGPAGTSPTVDAFAALKLEPWRLRVFPGTVLIGQGGSVLTWQA